MSTALPHSQSHGDVAPGDELGPADILRRMLCFNLFWHVLDIIWVALFTIVYLIGEGR